MRLTRTHLSLLLAVLLVMGGAAAGFLVATNSQPTRAADATDAAGQISAQDFDAAMAAAGFALDPASAGATAAPGAAGPAAGPAARLTAILGLRTRLARLARTLVHAQATLDLPARGIQTYALDQGTVQTVDATGLTISETGGATVSFSLSSATRVRAKGGPATLADVAGGADVIVISERSGGGWAGLAIVVVPPAAAPAASPSASD